jgi:type IV pilus assembly protein PilW
VLAQRQPVVDPELHGMTSSTCMAHRERGLSLVELMVGLTIGLFIVAGTLTLFANQVNSSRLLLQQARLQQEMRSAMDLVTRDLRRAGAWDNAVLGTVASGGGTVTMANDYAQIDFDPKVNPELIQHRFTRDATTPRVTENNTTDSDEQFGFKRDGDLLRMLLGGSGWQPITDPAVIKVTKFEIKDNGSFKVPLPNACSSGCGATCPALWVRQYVLTLTAELATDSSIKRTLSTTVRPRNDAIQGACP